MPDVYGHAKDFFNTKLSQGEFKRQEAYINIKIMKVKDQRLMI